MTTTTAPGWGCVESGPCAVCHAPTVRYGPHGRPLCPVCDGLRTQPVGVLLPRQPAKAVMPDGS